MRACSVARFILFVIYQTIQMFVWASATRRGRKNQRWYRPLCDLRRARFLTSKVVIRDALSKSHKQKDVQGTGADIARRKMCAYFFFHICD